MGPTCPLVPRWKWRRETAPQLQGLLESSVLGDHGTFTPEAEAPGTLVIAALELQRPRKAGDWVRSGMSRRGKHQGDNG